MNTSINTDVNPSFTSEAIEKQLERILQDTRFHESVILKKFLLFIVHETLQGRSNCLKEYTIAIEVLEKPVDFNPQQNGIVRIHAGRLRRALSKYYEEMGSSDPIIVSIPKGKYVPIFEGPESAHQRMVRNDRHYSSMPHREAKFSLAILPFMCPDRQELAKDVMDGICMRLSSMLAHLDHVNVVAYRAVSGLLEIHPDIKELGLTAGFNHIITGSSQCTKDKLRVNIQLIDCFTYRQIWSETYDRQLTKGNIFEIQDELCQYALNKVKELEENFEHEQAKLPMLSAI